VSLDIYSDIRPLGVLTCSTYSWKRDGEFHAAVQLGSSSIRWHLVDVEAWEMQTTCFAMKFCEFDYAST
jgi:predicted DNA-binding transcriptional regulator AlpA